MAHRGCILLHIPAPSSGEPSRRLRGWLWYLPATGYVASGKLPSYLEPQFLRLQNGDSCTRILQSSVGFNELIPRSGRRRTWHKLDAPSGPASLTCPAQEEEHSCPTALVTPEASLKPRLEIQDGGLFHKPSPQPRFVGAKQPPAMFSSALAQQSSGCPLVSDWVPLAWGWGSWAVGAVGSGRGEAYPLRVATLGERSAETPVSSQEEQEVAQIHSLGRAEARLRPLALMLATVKETAAQEKKKKKVKKRKGSKKKVPRICGTIIKKCQMTQQFH